MLVRASLPTFLILGALSLTVLPRPSTGPARSGRIRRPIGAWRR